MLSSGQGRPPLLFIAPRAKLVVAPSLGKTRGHRTLTGSHRTFNPQRPVLRRQPRVTSRLKTTVAANAYCARVPTQHHRTLYHVTLDPCAESSANSHGHRTRATGRTLSVRCSPDSCAERVAKTPAHQTLKPASGASTQCIRRETLPRLLQTSHQRNRKKYALNFLKSAESRRACEAGGRVEPTPFSSQGTPPSLQSVPTPQSVYQQVHVC